MISRFCVFVCLLALVLRPDVVVGCIWDRDTLGAETKGIPDAIEIISGRFDRFPPQYYEMRRDRILGEIAKTPDRLDLYDDLAVCYDRLGDSTTAIEWMEKKKSKIGDDSEHEYRYLANLGTFYAHRWLVSGVNFDDRADLEKASSLIGEAIELNPSAHFGREIYQLKAIDWLLNLKAPELKDAPVAHILDGNFNPHQTGTTPNSEWQKAIEGFGGLIHLGAAWESYDIFYALEMALRADGRNHVAYLARLRLNELSKAGKETLSSTFGTLGTQYGDILMDGDKEKLRTYYTKLRAESEKWQAHRLNYMEQQFEKGSHPDTHPEFWDNYAEKTSPPKMPKSSIRKTYSRFQLMGMVAICIIALLGMVFVIKRITA